MSQNTTNFADEPIKILNIYSSGQQILPTTQAVVNYLPAEPFHGKSLIEYMFDTDTNIVIATGLPALRVLEQIAQRPNYYFVMVAIDPPSALQHLSENCLVCLANDPHLYPEAIMRYYALITSGVYHEGDD